MQTHLHNSWNKYLDNRGRIQIIGATTPKNVLKEADEDLWVSSWMDKWWIWNSSKITKEKMKDILKKKALKNNRETN